MAALYWRVKKNGKWTWVKATKKNTDGAHYFTLAQYVEEEE